MNEGEPRAMNKGEPSAMNEEKVWRDQ